MPVEIDRPREGVVQLTLNRPDQLNALDAGTVAELTTVFAEIGTDPSCRVVILTGAGRGFCAGLDLAHYDDEPHPPARQRHPIDGLTRQRQIANLAVSLHQLPQPVIAAINGPAAGGGLALALASDIRMASTSALFAVGFIRAGFSACDIGLSWLLPRIVGTGRAHELMLTGRRCSAEEAYRIGLVTQLVDPAELLEAAYAEAAEIMLNPPFSVEMTKQGMWASVENPIFVGAVEFENRQQILTALTEDRDEATRAFLEKRPPVYQRY
jgi:enoyl-CoA hydratase